MKIAILGSGTWGTALANAFIKKHDVSVYSRFEEESLKLRTSRVHPNLKGAILDEKIVFSSDLKEAIKDAKIVIIATPSPFVRSTIRNAKAYLEKGQILVDVAKGIEEGSLLSMCEIIQSEVGPDYDVVCLSGPSHAEEVSLSLPTVITSSSNNVEAAKFIQKECSLPYFRIYLNDDLKGVELCAALKNIIALASGISCGLGFGDNAKAAIVTRGLAEITRLGLVLGAKKETFSGLAGIGDIVVTATSTHSRNFNAGYLIGQGYKLNEVQEKIGMVIEGLNSLMAAKELKDKYHVEMPIVEAIYDIVFNNVTPLDAVTTLFNRPLKIE